MIKKEIFKEARQEQHRILFALVLSALLFFLSALYIYYLNQEKIYSFTAQAGLMDLRDWNGEEILPLDGQWAFYPEELLEPDQEDLENYAAKAETIPVPKQWTFDSEIPNLTNSYGTYRLKIRLPEDGTYAIKTSTIRLSAKIYANGRLVSSLGNPSRDFANFVPQSRYQFVPLTSENEEIDLVIQVASFQYRTGGILKSIRFGNFSDMLALDRQEKSFELLTVSTCLMIGLYFIVNYWQRGRLAYLGYYGLSSFFIGLYLSTMNEQVFRLLGDFSFVTRTRFQVFAMVMMTFCIIRFVYHYFGEVANKKILNIFSGIILFNLVFTAGDLMQVNNILPFGSVQGLIMMGLVGSILYTLYVLVQAVFRNLDASSYILLFMTSFFIYFLTMSGKIFFEISLGKLPLLLILMVILSGSLLMNERLQSDYLKAQTLTQRLVEYDQLKDEFMTRAAHELRTPLHILLDLTKSLTEGKKGPLNEDQQEDMIFINREGKRMARLVEDLMDASKVEQESLHIRKEAVDIYSIVEDVLNEMKAFVTEDKLVKLTNQIPENFAKIHADRARCTQIIYNLLHNAIKFTQEGEILVTAEIQGDMAVIGIADTGRGIPKKEISAIYDIFYTRGYGENMKPGLGLGLSIVKQLVEMQDGSIAVDSIYGEGTRFSVQLPLYQEAQQEEEKNMAEQRVEKPGRREKSGRTEKMPLENLSKDNSYSMAEGEITILVVDDEYANQKAIQEILKEIGIKAVFAHSGGEALEMIEKVRVHMVILDFMLPDLSGDKICQKIRTQYSITEIPVLILTASGRSIDMMNAFESGANDYLKKPVDGEELKSRIQSLLLMKFSVEEGLNREFQYFYSQISPHFLYNTLNTIIGLCAVDVNRAKDALFHLSTYFRGKLEIYNGKQFIPLEEELDLVEAYIEIEKMRFSDRLTIEYDIDKDIQAVIPPLTIQPLVENAIRHGLMAKASGGKLRISAKKEDGMVAITVEDNGVGMDVNKQKEILSGKNNRIGFKNSLEKIKMMRNASVHMESQQNQGTKIIIKIPEVKTYESNFGG